MGNLKPRCNVCGKTAEEHKGGIVCCPFCGGEANFVSYGDRWYVRCSKISCQVEHPILRKTKKAARERWNTRPVIECKSVEDAVEALEGLAKIRRKDHAEYEVRRRIAFDKAIASLCQPDQLSVTQIEQIIHGEGYREFLESDETGGKWVKRDDLIKAIREAVPSRQPDTPPIGIDEIAALEVLLGRAKYCEDRIQHSEYDKALCLIAAIVRELREVLRAAKTKEGATTTSLLASKLNVEQPRPRKPKPRARSG